MASAPPNRKPRKQPLLRPRNTPLLKSSSPQQNSTTLRSHDALNLDHSARSVKPVPDPAPPILRPQLPWRDDPEVNVFMRDAPANLSTIDVYELLQRIGTIVCIEILEARREGRTEAEVKFRPAPSSSEWFHQGIKLGMYHITFGLKRFRARTQTSPLDARVNFPEEIEIKADEFAFGVMQSPNSMLKLHQAAPAEVKMSLHRNWIDIDFKIAIAAQRHSHMQSYRLRVQFAQLKEAYKMSNSVTGKVALVIPTELPPLMFRKIDDVKRTHREGASSWSEWQMWIRQTDIDESGPIDRTAAITQLRKECALVDIGRWLTYCLVFGKGIVASKDFAQFCTALGHYNIPVTEDRTIALLQGHKEKLWDLFGSPVAPTSKPLRTMSALHDLAEHAMQLDFPIQYQLEVCISQGLIHESNIDAAFIKKLLNLNPSRAKKLLEKVADERERFWDLDDIFKLLHQISVVKKAPPKYCAVIHSAVVTPTTVYFTTPVVETSNRVVRQFSQYADRFLRVKFTDEKYKGKIMSQDDDSMNEVFDRIQCTMKNGIKVGDRHFEFLAFGNSQFREGGAWFFASINNITAQSIRDWMGDFTHIREVARYCSRVGQCFSTTRALNIGEVEVKTISDIQRGKHNFTDGVGKISPFLAQMIAHQYRGSIHEYPSVFQFRLGGSKGVLTVDPTLARKIVEIRPSQAKFSSLNHADLNICRISQFSAANLNIQIILVLSALGVGDDVFLSKMDLELSDLRQAMIFPEKALELLCKNIDTNQATMHLAQMVEVGFMSSKDPFMMSCLQLWHSWSVKYLKEKARIMVRQGAFVLGCIDETATLKGHYTINEGLPVQNESILPEIFLQIPDPDFPHRPDSPIRWKVVTGVCALARNPSLHPGDIRVVRAVDVFQLRHLRNCVVLPQTGDRDVASMCSGGDLDGDDYLVIWDPDLLPQEWNYPPMNYDPPDKVYSKGDVTVDDMTSFFVTHIKHDNLSRIAVAHKYWADALPDGVKSAACLELANLHSMAVDFAKTSVPAKLPDRLKVRRWPHWAEVKNRSKKRIYTSQKVIGKLYDIVQRVHFSPQWHLPFDSRILNAYDKIPEDILAAAREAKADYDVAIRRIMAKFNIKSDFEVFTTFALEHSDDYNDYKFVETLGEVVSALKDHHQKLCYETAGTNEQERDREKMDVFITAMYKVTADEVQAALKECDQVVLKDGRWSKVKQPNLENMPFMSFPWLFTTELGRIANGGKRVQGDAAMVLRCPQTLARTPKMDLGNFVEPLEVVDLKPVESGNISTIATDGDDGDDDEECEMVTIEMPNSMSALDALEKRLAS